MWLNVAWDALPKQSWLSAAKPASICRAGLVKTEIVKQKGTGRCAFSPFYACRSLCIEFLVSPESFFQVLGRIFQQFSSIIPVFRGENCAEIIPRHTFEAVMERLARYLTKKGASVDSSIQWNSKHSPGKRPLEIDIFESWNRHSESAENGDYPTKSHEEDFLRNIICDCGPQKTQDADRLDFFSCTPTQQVQPHWNEETFSLNVIRECIPIASSNRSSLFDAPGQVGVSDEDCIPSHTTPTRHTVHWTEAPSSTNEYSKPAKPRNYPSELLSVTSSFASSCDSINSILSSMHSRRHSWPHSSSSLQLRTQLLPEATVLLIDIKDFTAQCAAMPAARVGEWVAAFYK